MRALLLLVTLGWLSPGTLAGDEFDVSGRFEYEDKEWDYSGWTGVDPVLPIRYADVTILDAGSNRVIGRGRTDDSGGFDIECRAKSPVMNVVARVDADNRRYAREVKAFPRIRIETVSKSLYAAFSTVASGHDTTTDLDLGTTTVLKVKAGTKEGNPFNVYDMGVCAFEYLTGPDVGVQRRGRTMRLHWPNALGSYALGNRAWIATDDGYDDAVILHEFGHLVHNAYSNSDNPGGIHYFGDSDQDPRLSFAEGWATAFGGMVMDWMGREALYVDSWGAAQFGAAQLKLKLESAAPYYGSVLGASDEVAVSCVIYDLIDDEFSVDGTPGVDDDAMVAATLIEGESPDSAWWSVFTGPVRRARGLTMNHAWDGWLSVHGDDPLYPSLKNVFEDRALNFWCDGLEPDNSREEANPIVASPGGVWGPECTLYFPRKGGFGPGTGDQDWYAVDLVAGDQIQIETRYPNGVFDATTQVDPYLTLYDPDGRRVATDDDSGDGRNARINNFSVTETGTWHFAVRSRDRMHRYGRYNVRVVLLSGS